MIVDVGVGDRKDWRWRCKLRTADVVEVILVDFLLNLVVFQHDECVSGSAGAGDLE
jgi:hypothetical protein